MGASPEVLDAAYDRLGQWGFDMPGGYPNHGPMVCEALDALERPAEVDSWSRLDTGTPPATPIESASFEWAEALGDPTLAGEWMGHFDRAVADGGWAPVLREWLPRLLPGMGAMLFHGAIRCAHATRAIEAADTPARRAELVRSLGYWAALYDLGHRTDLTTVKEVEDVQREVVVAAGEGARRYLARPTIVNLHGITAAMAVSILVRHVDDAVALSALAQLRAEHAALYEGIEPAAALPEPTIDEITLVDAAVASGDAHAVKLVEACQRGFAATGDPVFRVAAERVARRGLRALAAADE